MGTKAFDNYADLITFTRASGGTALRPVSYGAELVTNGTFDTDVSGWTLAGGTAAVDSSGVTLTNTSSRTTLSQTLSVVTGKVYRVTGTLNNLTSGANSARTRITSTNSYGGTVVGDVARAAGGDFEFEIFFVAPANTLYIWAANNATTAGLSVRFDNISVKEVLFDQPDGTLTLFNHPDNIPRIEYDADGNRLGLLIEEQRTNLFTYSEDISSWGQSPNALIDANAAIAPDGTLSAYKHYNVANQTINAYSSTSFSGISPNTTYTISWYQKYAGQQNTKVLFYTLETGFLQTTVNMVNKTMSSGTMTHVGNDWYFCQYQVTTSTSVTSPQFQFNRDTYSLDGFSGSYIWGFQLEQGSFPTSYIPTSGSTATRAADAASILVADFGYNQKQGTLFADVSSFGNNNFQYAAAITDSAAIGVYEISLRKAGGDWSYYVGGSANITEPFVSDAKLVGAYKQNSFNASINGSSETEDTSGTVPSNLVSLRIGRQGGFQLNGHIKSIKYYPRRLTNAQLQELTQ